jgi:hypothetical protein
MAEDEKDLALREALEVLGDERRESVAVGRADPDGPRDRDG